MSVRELVRTITPGRAVLAVVAGAVLVGGWADRLPTRPTVTRDGRQVVVADFHVHSAFGDGAIPPWNIGREARRRGLDAIAITNHNQVFASRLARGWSGRSSNGTLVLTGQEVTNPGFHVVAVGLRRAAGWNRSLQDTLADIHREGGVAIAAHPVKAYWGSFTTPELRQLDGSELCHPEVFSRPRAREELQGFHSRAMQARAEVGLPLAAIGSSDFHHLALIGRCRTLLMVDERSEQGILAAIRQGRTTAIADNESAAHGLPAVALPRLGPSGVLGWLGLLGLLLFGAGRRRPAAVR